MKKIITFGVFDYFHLGHLRLFENCKKHGDYLIVAVQEADYILRFKPNAKVLYTTQERVDLVKALRIVDEVIVYKVISPEFLAELDYDILAVGEDQTNEHFTHTSKWCVEQGKEVIRMRRTPNICSSDIKKGIN